MSASSEDHVIAALRWINQSADSGRVQVARNQLVVATLHGPVAMDQSGMPES